MKKLLTLTLLAGSMVPQSLFAQEVDRTKYPDFSAKINPDASLMRIKNTRGQRPAYVNNAETKHFPPVFNQDGGSCGSASRICYMFTHELNAFRNLDGKDPNNYYPSHFVWLLTNGNSGKDAFVQHIGVPSAAIYGGQTYSKYFGNQDTTNPDFGWMTGYDKWYSAMFNRMLQPKNFPVSVQTEEGREAVKNWLWNHNGDDEFSAGGIAGIGVASGGQWFNIESTPTNDEIGVTGKFYVKKWGTQVDHALTIVGYDDRIEFDLNGNGKFGEKSADEVGAWIIVNSWGDGWCNNGFIYCPYAHAVPAFNANGTHPNNYWMPEIYRVRKNYEPQRTIKLKMNYSRRSELYLSAGVSADLNATEPESAVAFEHFKYAGDGNGGWSEPAPEVPMLGRWADGKLHEEPMEFGYDLTDLSAGYDANQPLKYFFIIDTRNYAEGTGKIHAASIIDYVQNAKGVETPFFADGQTVDIQNKGKRTIISVVVQGRGVNAPQNLSQTEDKLMWQAPVKSSSVLTGYKVYKNGELVATLAPDVLSYDLNAEETGVCTYSVSAIYGEKESTKVNLVQTVGKTAQKNVNFKKSGLRIPGVFGNTYQKATIEYWMNCNSLSDWNQSAGPGWGNFMFHANSDGRLTVGWNTNGDRMDISGAYTRGQWKHIAIVIDGHKMTAYVNGVRRNSFTSDLFSGVGGFGDLVFTNAQGKSLDAKVDEFRIWKTARTDKEIKDNYNKEFGDAGLPEDLMVYYKGDMINDNGVMKLRDHTVGQHHGVILDANYTAMNLGGPTLTAPADLSVAINEPAGTVYAGVPVKLSAKAGLGVESLSWSATEAGMNALKVISPVATFAKAGAHTVKVVAHNIQGETTEAERVINVAESPAPTAEFTASKTTVPAGDAVSFIVKNFVQGYTYHWDMPGAEEETADAPNAAAVYNMPGKYKVTLTVTGPDGKKASSEVEITVAQVAPLASFRVEPNVVMKGEWTKLINTSKYGAKKLEWKLQSAANVMAGEGELIAFRPDQPGIYDVILTATNEAGQSTATEKGGLVVCNADSKNGLNFTGNASLKLTKVPFKKGQREFTVDWWMNPRQLKAMGNGIGDNVKDFMITTSSNGAMEVTVDGRKVTSGANFVIPGSWHHYALKLKNGSLFFYRDGEKKATMVVGRTIPELSQFCIGGSVAPFDGQIDEFRVWSKSMTDAKLQGYCNQPLEGAELETAISKDGLQLYYQFNQAGGDVQDATPAANHGVRTNFGPEGDAWGLSKGVFSLNFTGKAEDVTAKFLTNYKAPFATTGKVVNTGARFKELDDWTLENVDAQGTGFHVDTQKDSYMTITTTWDGFSASIEDQKTYQTITLPAGAYEFTANYGKWEGQAVNTYLVATAGKALPNTADLDAEALAYLRMEPVGATKSNTLIFALTEETEVSIGLLANQSGKNCMSLESFNLKKLSYQPIVNDPSGVDGIVTESKPRDNKIYDLFGRRVLTPQKGGVYIIGGQKVVIK